MFTWLLEKAIGFEGKNIPITMAIIGFIGLIIPFGITALIIACAIKFLRS